MKHVMASRKNRQPSCEGNKYSARIQPIREQNRNSLMPRPHPQGERVQLRKPKSLGLQKFWSFVIVNVRMQNEKWISS